MDRGPNPLQLRLLGGFELRSDRGRDTTPAGRKVRALLACLALSPGYPWPREKLMALLWSDRGEEQARASLRQALAELRRTLGEPSPLRTEHDVVNLDPATIVVDALEFERLAKAGKMKESAALYRGLLLEGHGVRDGAFEEWLLVERTRLHDLAIGVFDHVAASQSGEAAIETAQRLLTLDPAREETHRLLMRLYADAGQRAQALRQYQHCRDTLRRELQAVPDIETERLHRQIQDATAPPLAARAAAATPAPAQPPDSKPCIAVLPFTNMSDGPGQQYFSDGIAEDIITELSRYRSLLVIARNSSFQFRDRSADMDVVRQRLGVRYIVEGSVRRSGARLRIATQLIDAVAQTHLWAERYDRDMLDVFAVQDEVARTIAATLEGRVAASGAELVKRKPPADWRAYDHFLQGRACEADFDLVGAVVCYNHAIEMDPAFVHAHAWRAKALIAQYWQDQQPEQLRQAEASAQAALALDNNDPWPHQAMAFVAMHQRKFDLAGGHLDRALILNPNDAGVAADRGAWLVRTGRPDAALQCLDAAMQRDPFPAAWVWSVRWRVLFHLKRYEEAIAALRNMVRVSVWHHAYLAATYAHLGDPDNAHCELAAFLQAKPGATLATIAAADPYADKSLLQQLLAGLSKAGLPE